MKTAQSLQFLCLVIFCLTVGMAKAQPNAYSSTNARAIKLYEEALKFYDARQDQKASEVLEAAIKKDPNFIECYVMLADINTELKHFEKSIEYFKKTFEINPKFFPNNFYSVANIELYLGRYEDAKAHYKAFLSFPRINPDLASLAELEIKSCDFSIDAIKHPVPFEIHNLGAAINSSDYEYYPAITADDQQFLFTRNIRSELSSRSQEDFYLSKKNGKDWMPAINIGPPINSDMNEGAPTLSADGQMLIFTGCDRPGGIGSCDLYTSKKIGDKWSRPVNLGPKVNSKYWDSQPSFSSDGKTLYFVSNRPGGIGKNNADIWMTTLEGDDWSAPVNLGPGINTIGQEESPYIHPDTKTLYFASNGRVGLGQSDIYVARKDENGLWKEPVNLGYPINSNGNENSLMVSGSGELAYFASDRAGGFGGLDIYSFPLYEGARPQKISYMKGKVYDSKTKKPIGATFELIDLSTSKTVIESKSNQLSGEFLVCLPVDKNYALNVAKQGYLFFSENFAMKDAKDPAKPFLMDVPLQPIDTGMVVQLKNIFFETAKFTLKEESKIELQKLISFLEFNKSMKIEIGGHTDNVGDKQANKLLSQNRAKAVFDYLVEHQIAKERLSFKGYGDTKPIAPNDSPENRQLNRRTEFKVTGK